MILNLTPALVKRSSLDESVLHAVVDQSSPARREVSPSLLDEPSALTKERKGYSIVSN